MSSKDLAPVVHEQYLADHRQDHLRSGEGAMEVLSDGSLLLIYGRFVGDSDWDRATLVQQRSTDGGRTWSTPTTFTSTPKKILNLMSVSLLQLADGRLACVYLVKVSNQDCRPVIVFSDNLGQSWSKPVKLIPDSQAGYYVVNNDRLVQLASGRLLVPFDKHGKWPYPSFWKSASGCLYSDDAGQTWQFGERQDIQPEHVARPRFLDKTVAKTFKQLTQTKRIVCQESGVVELTDGRVMMWCRTDGGYMYQAFSKDGGITFSPFKAMRSLAMPCGPQSIKRLPKSDRLVMLYNDRREIPLGHPQFDWRRTLDVAVSDDNAKSWRRIGLLEPDSVPSTCYYSICFHNNNALFTYYEGVMMTAPSGWFFPSNLHSLKLKVIKQDWLRQ